MQVIRIKENQKEIWNEFITENCSESFLQAWEWGEFQKSLGRKVWRIGVIDGFAHTPSATQPTPLKRGINKTSSKLIAVALIVKHDLPFGRSYFYCPRGPVISLKSIKPKVHKVKSLDFLFSEIKKIAKREKSLFLKIDPPIGVNQELRTPPFKKGAGGIFKKSLSEVQPRDTLILDLTKSEEELLKDMKQKTRYNIRLAGKKELRITNYELRTDDKENFKEKFENFWELVKETSRRDKFVSHVRDYYWKMLENLAGAGLQPVPNVFRIGEKENETSKRKELVTSQFPHTQVQDDKYQVQRDKQNLRAKLYLAEYDNKIIAANIVLHFGDLAVYLHGASSSEYRNIMAPYLLQWRQIMDAKKIGCEKYDFWGVSSGTECPRRGHSVSWGGITKFKKGFGGFEKNYIGAYDLIFNSIEYTIYRFMKSIKSKIHKVKSLFYKK